MHKLSLANTLCRDFIDRRLNLRSCMRFLLEGVQYNDEHLQDNCIALFSRSKLIHLLHIDEHLDKCTPACMPDAHFKPSSTVLRDVDFHKACTQTAEGLPPETIEAILSHKVGPMQAFLDG